MNYKKITFDGRTYKYHVGRKNIEIRNDDDGPNFKLIVPRPDKQQRWGVIRPNWDGGSSKSKLIEIFEREDWAQNSYEMLRTNASPTLKSQIELVPLPSKTVAITPSWIREAIEIRAMSNT